MRQKFRNYLRSERTSYASATSLKTLSASSRLSGFLSGCHLRAILRYLYHVNGGESGRVTGSGEMKSELHEKITSK